MCRIAAAQVTVIVALRCMQPQLFERRGREVEVSKRHKLSVAENVWLFKTDLRNQRDAAYVKVWNDTKRTHNYVKGVYGDDFPQLRDSGRHAPERVQAAQAQDESNPVTAESLVSQIKPALFSSRAGLWFVQNIV